MAMRIAELERENAALKNQLHGLTEETRFDQTVDQQDETADHAKFASGAKRSELAPAYRLIPPEFTHRLANRYALGNEKYGSLNYLKGLADSGFTEQLVDHVEHHLNLFKLHGCSEDDNLAAIGWGVATLCVVEAHVPQVLEHWRTKRKLCIRDAQDSLTTEAPNFFIGSKSGK